MKKKTFRTKSKLLKPAFSPELPASSSTTSDFYQVPGCIAEFITYFIRHLISPCSHDFINSPKSSTHTSLAVVVLVRGPALVFVWPGDSHCIINYCAPCVNWHVFINEPIKDVAQTFLHSREEIVKRLCQERLYPIAMPLPFRRYLSGWSNQECGHMQYLACGHTSVHVDHLELLLPDYQQEEVIETRFILSLSSV
jgi:hypothetical protein